MKLENSIFEEKFLTSYTQTGIHGVLTNKSILSLMERTAGLHSAYCKFSFADIAKDNLTWIILNWKLKVLKRPKAEERIVIQTWGRKFNKLFVIRDFKLFNSKGELYAIASSKWCLVDTSKNKIARMPENIPEIYGGFRDESVFDIEDLPRLREPKLDSIGVDTYKIRRFDLDINKHVHNTNYLNFAYEVLPFEIYTGEELNNLEIYYKNEIKYGETIKSFLYFDKGVYTIATKSEDEQTLHSIVRIYN